MDLPDLEKKTDDYCKEFETVIKEKQREGITVIRSNPYQLLIDLDNKESIEIFHEMFSRLQDIYPVKSCEYWKSKSKKNYHVYIQLGINLSIEERIALQTILGSDKLREFLSLMRVRYLKIAEPSLLFRPKDVIVKNYEGEFD